MRMLKFNVGRNSVSQLLKSYSYLYSTETVPKSEFDLLNKCNTDTV